MSTTAFAAATEKSADFVTMNVQVRRLTLICSRMWTGARKDTPSPIIKTPFRAPANPYFVSQLTTSLRAVLPVSFRLLLLVLPFQLSCYHSSSTSFSRRLSHQWLGGQIQSPYSSLSFSQRHTHNINTTPRERPPQKAASLLDSCVAITKRTVATPSRRKSMLQKGWSSTYAVAPLLPLPNYFTAVFTGRSRCNNALLPIPS